MVLLVMETVRVTLHCSEGILLRRQVEGKPNDNA